MVVITRSYKKRQFAAAAGDNNILPAHRRVKIVSTPSFRDASIRTYKIYSPTIKPSSCAVATLEEEEEEDDERIATEALVDLQSEEEDREPQFVVGCINPMRPITQYMYSINVYNRERTLHYKTAYILYDKSSRLYHVLSIISNCFPDADAAPTAAAATAATASGYPSPVNTVQMKYATYVNDSVVNYIMTLIVPSNEYNYFIQDDVIGFVTSKEELAQTAFTPESSFYDITHLFNDNTSRETVNGYKAFDLTSRTYWRDPTSTGPSYTESVIHSVLLIL